jgi:hypothetical protein
MMFDRESRIPQAGQGAGSGLPNFKQSSAVYIPFISVVLLREDLALISSVLVLSHSRKRL